MFYKPDRGPKASRHISGAKNLPVKTGFLLPLLALGCTVGVRGQSVVSAGGGSYASEPPAYKARTAEHPSGFNASNLLSRPIFADELPSERTGAIDVPGRPLPTNDWWTDLLASRFSGAMWSYPAMLHTSQEGVRISYPTFWADAGKEMKSRSSLTVGGVRFVAESAIAADWHDWDVVMRLPASKGNGSICATAAHGMPFTWFECENVTPEIRPSGRSETFGEMPGCLGLRVGDDLYGIYFPETTVPDRAEGNLRLTEGDWCVVALLRDESDLQLMARYATSVPRDTEVSWSYDEKSSRLYTHWHVKAENLRHPGSTAPVMQGFLPHAYKYALPGADLHWSGSGYRTPRGEMKMATSDSGEFGYSYQFTGMLPTYAAPAAGDVTENGFDPEILEDLTADYAAEGSFGGDTYWGGKGLTQMALNMTFAKEAGLTAIYDTSRRRLREAFEDWLTYTPGEDRYFFSYYPRWGAMLGFDVSYDSDAFNDHHFHYGYFTYAAALLCMEDADFAEKYRAILTLIAKDYANWDCNDKRFPFMRTFDPWCGHSWAGGMGDGGNDNGNGQESTSEAMQGWGGIYLLGVALGDKEMRDAGLFGWNTEARATREYWYDVDAPRPTNAGGREAWGGKGDRQGNYDYNEYPYAYNSNITGKGIGWWTWFGGDPLFMHGIQWMPISPALDYLSWDTDFTAWAYRDMMNGANSSFSHKWFEPTINSDDGGVIEPLAYNDWGNVALSYLQRSDPKEAASIFARARREGLHIATGVSTAHISYYVIHSHLTWGEQDFSVTADLPTAVSFVKDGTRSYMVYNPDKVERAVTFRDSGGSVLRTVLAPPSRLTVFTADAFPTAIEVSVEGEGYVAPGSSAQLYTRLLDQYGATVQGEPIIVTAPAGSGVSITDDRISVSSSAIRGSEVTLTLRSGDLTESCTIILDEPAEVREISIAGVPEMIEMGTSVTPALFATDQYSRRKEVPGVGWSYIRDEGEQETHKGTFTPVRAGIYTVSAVHSGMTAETRMFVTPPMPSVSSGATAIGSSAENGGCLPLNVNDGDRSTRWGSAHTEDEWIMLDLGEEKFLSRATIDWEAAYAAEYAIQVAPAGCQMTTYTGNYAGESKTYTVPADEAWQTVAIANATGAGVVATRLGTTGRYVRIKGLRRGTVYGYSIYELTLYGLSGSMDREDVIGIDFALPSVMNSGETVRLNPVAYHMDGASTDVEADWSADKEALFEGDDFTPTGYGVYAVTADASGRTTSATTFVNETEKPLSLHPSPTDLTLTEGEAGNLKISVYNQFDAPCRRDLPIEVTVLDAYGQPSSALEYDIRTGKVHGNIPGEYEVKFSCGELESTVPVRVVAFSDSNLALGKSASASTVRDGNRATFANDGTTDTRWESEWEDNQWISIDLDGRYEIDRMVIVWEGAYARDYRVEVSLDGLEWREIYVRRNGNGGTETLSLSPVEASYVRILCDVRGLQAYGFSIRELEIYGLRRLSGSTGIESVGTKGETCWYDLNGHPVSAPAESDGATRGLKVSSTGDKVLTR